MKKFIRKRVAKETKKVIRKKTINLGKKGINAVGGIVKKKGPRGGHTKILDLLVPKEEGEKKAEEISHEVKQEEVRAEPAPDPAPQENHESGLFVKDGKMVWL